MSLPEGTVTFLRSDIEGSMELMGALGGRYDELNAEHAELVRAGVGEHGGHVVRTEGDAFFAVFTDAGSAALAAVDIQRAMAEHPWPEGHPFRVRIGIHTGAATRAGDDYGGFEVNRAARIAAVGWGGQIVLSGTTRALIAADPDAGWTMTDLGRHHLKGVPEPEALFQLTAPGLLSEFPDLRSEAESRSHLPSRNATFLGRDRDLETLTGLFTATRLLTLTGPGGTGKTTLALELARQHAGEFADGTWFVDVEPVGDASGVRPQIARSLGLFDGPAGPAETRLDAYLADRSVLLVIDNFEHVVAAADAVARLLSVSPTSHIIVTSRSPLRVAAEQEYPVPPLAVDGHDVDGHGAAVRLFVERARQVRPGLELDDAALQEVNDLCRLLDGLPLAIELCASRAGALPVPMMLERLRARLPLPGSGPRDLPQRQQTMEDTVAWSYDLLDPSLQDLLVCLAVFEGSFDYLQAEEVCGVGTELDVDVLDGLVRLTDQSLVSRVEDAGGGFRFVLLETVRNYAAGRQEPDRETILRDRHAAAYRALAASLIPDFAHWTTRATMDRLEADARNLLAACRWLIERDDAAAALDLTARSWRFWLRSGRMTMGRELLDAAMASAGADRPTTEHIRALSARGSLAYWSGDLDEARRQYEAELALATEVRDLRGQADAYFNLAFVHSLSGRYDAGRQAVEEAQRSYEELGDEDGIGRLLVASGTLVRFQISADRGAVSEDPDAIAKLEALVEQTERLSNPVLRAGVHGQRSILALLKGDFATAGQEGVAGMRAELAAGDDTSVLVNLQIWVPVLAARGFPELAAICVSAVEAGKARFGIEGPATYDSFTPGFEPMSQLRERLDEDVLEAALARGRSIPLAVLLDLLSETVGELAERMRRA